MTAESTQHTHQTPRDPKGWEAVIGLEIHAELNTQSKLFSVAPNRFGDAPNTNITDVCLGLPGTLPVLNEVAVRKAVSFGCAVNAEVCTFSKFDRKSYFYPDSPRNFQITQFDEPIIKGGTVIAEVGEREKPFQINRVHLEDDAGMLKHFPDHAGVDYNRAGVPLIEIVSEPCIHTPKEAAAYAQAVKAILEYIDASDCNMEEGSLRFDANVSVRPKGEQTLRTKIEIKNMNSFAFMEQALESEIRRQIREYINNADKDPKDVIAQATYRWDANANRTVLMRRKETEDDYRYFPEPDLPPIVLDPAYIEEIRAALPELPLERKRRYTKELLLSEETAYLLASDKRLSDYFETALQTCNDARALANWMTVEFPGRLRDSDTDLLGTGIEASNIARLVNLIDAGTITGKIAKRVAADMIASPSKDCEKIVAENPEYQPVADLADLEPLVDAVLAEHEQSVSDYKSGKQKAFGFLVGQVMKATKGAASPQVVNQLLRRKLDA